MSYLHPESSAACFPRERSPINCGPCFDGRLLKISLCFAKARLSNAQANNTAGTHHAPTDTEQK
jgi:hypothetical protein